MGKKKKVWLWVERKDKAFRQRFNVNYKKLKKTRNYDRKKRAWIKLVSEPPVAPTGLVVYWFKISYDVEKQKVNYRGKSKTKTILDKSKQLQLGDELLEGKPKKLAVETIFNNLCEKHGNTDSEVSISYVYKPSMINEFKQAVLKYFAENWTVGYAFACETVGDFHISDATKGDKIGDLEMIINSGKHNKAYAEIFRMYLKEVNMA